MFNKSTVKVSYFFILLAFSLETSPHPWYHDYFHQLNGINYARNCSLINFAQKIREAARVAYHSVVHNKSSALSALAAIEKQLTEFESQILQAEEDALLAIKKKYAISDEHWQQCMNTITEIKKNAMIGMTNAHDGVRHDPNIPHDIRTMITDLLIKNGINPESVHLVLADQTKVAAKPQNLAETMLFILVNKDDPDPITNKKYIPAHITIFPRMIDLTETGKKSICAHEVQHLICQHAIVNLVLTTYLAHYYGAEKTELEQSEEYQNLNQIQEAQAEILAAIHDPVIAQHLKAFRQTDYYPKNLYEEHFYCLSTIAMLWNIHGKMQSLITH